jgi:Fe2+ or Zn2+ uptake regulation protein
VAIVREVLQRNHPTASEIFAGVRAQYPTMGLGTVYATLNRMSEHGLLNVLPVAEAVRFDANVAPHANLICTQCGTIVDFDDCEDVLEQLRQRTQGGAGFAFTAEHLDLYGTCAHCRASP